MSATREHPTVARSHNARFSIRVLLGAERLTGQSACYYSKMSQHVKSLGRVGEISGKKVYVGLSGGVDSAVTAALLREAGARVTGVFIKGWYPPGLPCTWAFERRDAMRVAARLHVPFATLDASEEYKKDVIDYLLAEYRAGCTPNPDVMCNKEVKFGAFYHYAMARCADFIATGHYACTPLWESSA